MGPSAQAAQQAAIQATRARYERGELSYETFRRALDAIVLARTPDECQAILAALPANATAASLAALDAPSPPAPITANEPPARISAIMGQTKRMRRAWRLAPNTEAVAFMGEIKLDLGRAELPPTARLRVSATMGTVIVYVPRGVEVVVRSRAWLGEVSALGETVSGIFASGHERHSPTDTLPTARIEIDAFTLMGNVKVVLTDESALSVAEIVRDALRAVGDGIRRGWVQGQASPRRDALDPRTLR